MTLFDALYSIFIGPLKLLFEVVFANAYYLVESSGVSIIVLSLFMNFLLLPFYNQADRIQDEENEIEKKLNKGVTHIKKTFKGDQRYMMTQTYYRQNDYKPIYALKGLIPLLLEIPFFIAAYDFLSNLEILNSASFGPITDLSNPDGILFGLNILPIIMTIVNVTSSMIYAKEAPLKTKVQLYVMAIAFLFILYDSPSGLVLYWTLNNVFSLVKNIVKKSQRALMTLCVLCSILGIVGLVYVAVVNPTGSILKQFVLIFGTLILQLPLIFTKIKINNHHLEIKNVQNKYLFILCCIYLTVFIGALIPINLIKSSTSEFVDYSTYANPLEYVLSCLLLATGTFVVWFGIAYYFANSDIKKIFNIFILATSIIVTVDYYFFGTGLGTLSSKLIYENGLVFSNSEKLINIFVICLVFVAVIILSKKIKFNKLILITTVASMIMCLLGVNNINSDYDKYMASVEASKENPLTEIELSKNNKNVIIIILDRAISSYFPYIINELPELQEQYAGFTYYPNTVSFGAHTNIAIPAVYGGYEYTPSEMNERSDESLAEKHTEALKVLPVLFEENGFKSIVCDQPYANYEENSSEDIYKEYKDIESYTTYGTFDCKEIESASSLDYLNRNIFCYSIMKCLPVLAQSIAYNYGCYNDIENYIATWSDSDLNKVSLQTGIDQYFVNSYSVLLNLSQLTTVSNSKGTFLSLYNLTTHTPTLLKEPDYAPVYSIDNIEYDKENKDRYSINGDSINLETEKEMSHYHVNAASLIQLGIWFDYLRELGVYDNTRIIIVSDHGYNINQFEDLILSDETDDEGYIFDDIMFYNPLLLYKDFNCQEFKVDNAFMTNADVATLAVSDLLDNTLNPFTGNDITKYGNKDIAQLVSFSHNLNISTNNGNVFLPGTWYEISNNIFDVSNWVKMD